MSPSDGALVCGSVATSSNHTVRAACLSSKRRLMFDYRVGVSSIYPNL